MTLLGPLGVTFAVLVGSLAVVFALWATGRDGRHRTAPRVPFSGGGAPKVHAWSRYHARYYVMALIFLAFDMEMVYMYPWAVVFVSEGPIAIAEMGMFIAILLLGVLYTWRERGFEWA